MNEAPITAPPARLAPTAVLAVAAWTAVVSGFLEGAILDAARFAPKLLAPYKASAHQLYLAPVVDAVVFACIAPTLLVLLRLTRRWTAAHEPRIVTGAFLFLGALTVLATPRLVHLAAAAVLALGIAVAASRALAGREAAAAAWLRRRVWVLALLVGVVALSVTGWQRWSEGARSRSLPPVERRP